MKLKYLLKIKGPKYIPQTLVETVSLTPIIQWSDVDVTGRKPVFAINTMAVNHSPKGIVEIRLLASPNWHVVSLSLLILKVLTLSDRKRVCFC